MTGVWFLAWAVKGFFLFITLSQPAPGTTQLPVQWVPGAVSLGVKQPGHEANHWPQSTAGVKSAWSYTSTPHTLLSTETSLFFTIWCYITYTVEKELLSKQRNELHQFFVLFLSFKDSFTAGWVTWHQMKYDRVTGIACWEGHERSLF
jgi:hypothetical protein